MTNYTQNQINEIIDTQDTREAVMVLNYLKKHPEEKIDDQQFLQLQYIRMNSMSEQQLLTLMTHSLLVAYTIPDFDLDARIRSYIEQLDYIPAEIIFIKNLIQVLENSKEILGSVPIGGWIKDFLHGSTNAADQNALSELQYLNTSSSVKSLTTTERLVLQNIIKLYDFAQQSIYEWNTTEVPKNPEEALKNYDLYSFFPELADDLEEQTGMSAVKPVSDEAQKRLTEEKPRIAIRPVIPVKPVAPPKPITPTEPVISTAIPDNLPSLKAPVVEAGIDAPVATAKKPTPAPTKTVPVQPSIDLKNPTAPFSAKGLTFTDGHSVQALEEQQKVVERRRLAASEALKKEEEIEKKLAALKTRNKTNTK